MSAKATKNSGEMLATGVVRLIDEAGRYVIPREIRRNLDISVGDPLEVFVEGENIILRKPVIGCIFCGETQDVITYNKKAVCGRCIGELKNC